MDMGLIAIGAGVGAGLVTIGAGLGIGKITYLKGTGIFKKYENLQCLYAVELTEGLAVIKQKCNLN